MKFLSSTRPPDGAYLQNEVRILLHLISKVDPATLDYRLSPKQRSLLDLLQYLVFMPEVHMRAALADSFSLDGFQTAWQAGEATAKAMNLAQITEAIGRQRALFEELLSPCSDAIFARKSKCSGTRPAAGRCWFCSCCLITPPIACSCSCI
jgi:hypothetical protein